MYGNRQSTVVYIVAMNGKRKTENCLVCGSALDYLHQSENLVCVYCGAADQGHVKCPEGHFVCETCHRSDAMQMIEGVIFTTELKDPVAIAELMMGHPNLPMLGCEHAYIAAGALMAALKNSPYGKGKITDADIREVFARTAKQAVSGYCGLTGVCGIAPAVGACLSIFLGSRCGSDTEQKITMNSVIKVSQVVAELTGPSCCKAYVRAALSEAVTIFMERFGIVLPVAKTSIVCKDSNRHPHGCREERCPYYRKPARDIFVDPIHLPAAACQS
jgi:hypothetical protein